MIVDRDAQSGRASKINETFVDPLPAQEPHGPIEFRAVSLDGLCVLLAVVLHVHHPRITPSHIDGIGCLMERHRTADEFRLSHR